MSEKHLLPKVLQKQGDISQDHFFCLLGHLDLWSHLVLKVLGFIEKQVQNAYSTY